MHVTKNAIPNFVIFVSVFTAKEKYLGLCSGKCGRLKISSSFLFYEGEVFP
jgi:hypothetical protein